MVSAREDFIEFFRRENFKIYVHSLLDHEEEAAQSSETSETNYQSTRRNTYKPCIFICTATMASNSTDTPSHFVE
jgi:hypothetical protein